MKELSRQAKFYISGTVLLGFLLIFWFVPRIPWTQPGLLVLAVLAGITQVKKVDGPANSTYNLAWLIYGFTFVHYGVAATVLVVVAAHLAEWIWHKIPWYIQCFNIGSYTLVVTFTYLIFQGIIWQGDILTPLGTIGLAISLGGFTLLNHLMVGEVIWLARGKDFRQSGVFGLLTLMIDFTLVGLGAAAALVWSINAATVFFVLVPLYLIYRTLQLPALQRETELDPKTKVYNARYFSQALEREFARATSYNRPLTLVMGDLDLLREINNSYGHLAGDVVLQGVARILQNEFRDLNVVARFGGEEFSILLPETSADEAYERVEKARRAIARQAFQIDTSVAPIMATMSFGICDINAGIHTANDLIHNADVALYAAKAHGRNCTHIFDCTSIKALFGEHFALPKKVTAPLGVRFTSQSYPTIPAPSRETEAEVELRAAEPGIRRRWAINLIITAALLLAMALTGVVLQPPAQIDWVGFAVIALVVVLTEGLSIEIYNRDASISTSAVPFIAGIILFGSPGAVLLSLVLAATAMIKKGSPFHRFVFNFSNHLIASAMSAGLLQLAHFSVADQPPLLQLAVSILIAVMIYTSSTLWLAWIVSASQGKKFSQVWSEQFLWLWPYYLSFGVAAYGMVLGYLYAGVFGAIALLVPALALRFSQIQYLERTKALVDRLKRNNTKLENQSHEIVALNEELLFTLANIIDLRDPFTSGHSRNVAEYAGLLAGELGFERDQIVQIRKACLLHDIGKLGVPEAVIYKPGPLTAEESEIVKRHPVLGANIVQSIHALQPLVPVVRHHHERFDGRGYPDRLAGEQIPLIARIACLADALEAMATDRPYRQALGFEEIITEVRRNTGTQFDPQVVRAFMRLVERYGRSFITKMETFKPAVDMMMVPVQVDGAL